MARFETLKAQVAERIAEWRTATAFLTRLPVGPCDGGDADLARTVWAFPVVGWGMGLGAGAVFAVGLAFGLGPLPAAVVCVAFEVWLAGALHEDGLADTADALGGETIAQRLGILRDARIGTFGATALVLSLMARAGAVAALADPWLAAMALSSAGAASRAALTWPMALVPPARTEGLGVAAGVPTSAEAAAATLAAAALVLVTAGGSAVLFALAAAAAGTGLISGLARRKFGGQTGDLLGAAQQVSYVAVLLALSAKLVS